MAGWLNSLYGSNAREHREQADQQKQAQAQELKKHFRKHGKPRFDRVGYMRDYMRRRRAQLKQNPIKEAKPPDGA